MFRLQDTETRDNSWNPRPDPWYLLHSDEKLHPILQSAGRDVRVWEPADDYTDQSFCSSIEYGPQNHSEIQFSIAKWFPDFRNKYFLSIAETMESRSISPDRPGFRFIFWPVLSFKHAGIGIFKTGKIIGITTAPAAIVRVFGIV